MKNAPGERVNDRMNPGSGPRRYGDYDKPSPYSVERRVWDCAVAKDKSGNGVCSQPVGLKADMEKVQDSPPLSSGAAFAIPVFPLSLQAECRMLE